MPETEFVAFLKPWIAKPFNQLPPEIQTIVWEWLPQRPDSRYLLPPRRFVSVWDDLDENERLKAARNIDLAFELGFRGHPEGSRDIDAQFIDIKAWDISRFGSGNENAPSIEATNDSGEGPPPEIPAWLSPMELAAYAATNNPWLVARCAPDGVGCELDHLEFQAIHSQALSPTKVLERTVNMLRAGKIVMTALRDGIRREMPAEDWRYWKFRTSPDDKNALMVCDVTGLEPVVGWTKFLMSREQANLVRAALLGRETPSRPVSDVESRSVGSSEARISKEGIIPVPDKALLVDQRPKPTDQAVRLWFRNRVDTWPDNKKAPGEAADWEAIKQHFAPGLSRNEDFRLARKQETDSGWRKQGRRPLWGVEKKSAG